MRQRGFEVVSAYADKGIRLPQRKTAGSAGYDMEAAEAVILEPHRVTVIPTGLKAYMPADEYLGIHVRFSRSSSSSSSLNILISANFRYTDAKRM